MENKNDDDDSFIVVCLIILAAIINLSMLDFMCDEHKEQTYAIQNEIRQLRTELEYHR